MITYGELYDFLRKEKYSEQLQRLPKNFLQQVAEYFKEKRSIAERKGSIFSDAVTQTKKQLDNSIAILRELITRRERKIVNLALIAAKTGISKRDAENMLEYEKELFEAMTKRIEHTEQRLAFVIEGKEQEKKDLKNRLVRFKQDVSEFLDLDATPLGPFRKGEIANLPKELADIIIKSKQAIPIE